MAAIGLLGVAPQEPWVPVAPSDPDIRWLGRVDLSVSASPRMAWSGSGFWLEFDGTGVVATLETFSQEGPAGVDRYSVRVDRGLPIQLDAPAGEQELVLATGLEPGRHVIEVRKTTEGMVGTGVLYALTLEPHSRLRNPHPGLPRRIEVVGGTEACGYGVRTTERRPPTGFDPAHEDYLLAWPYLVGESLAAQVQTVCYSGRGLLPAAGQPDLPQLPELWRLSLPHEADAVWDFDRYVPDLLVLQLGAQDLGQGRPSRRVFRAALDRWIRSIRDVYPDAWILLNASPTVTASWPEGGWGPDWLSERFSEQLALADGRGDARVQVLPIAPIAGPWGTDYQPTSSAQAALAMRLSHAIQDLTGWVQAGAR